MFVFICNYCFDPVASRGLPWPSVASHGLPWLEIEIEIGIGIEIENI